MSQAPPRASYQTIDYHGYRLRVYEGEPPTATQRVIDWFVANPGVTVTVADLTDLLELSRQVVSGAVSRISQKGFPIHSGPRGLPWTYDPNRPVAAGSPKAPKARQTGDLKPITDHIDDDAFKAAGLLPVATASDGDRICVDDAGLTWRVKVTVEATLL